ncbi:MAG: anaerobic ribonucleoside-triphosphate reductase activating protein [Bacilli bacterium]|nr:anaerobic ribonucleoside-triphosphate reductase activating protein [Bacilli bacterium]
MEKLSLVDYDDNLTATLFMAGCPFRCPFCHNADLVLHPEKAEVIPFATIMDYLQKRQGVLDAVCITGGEPTLMPDLEEKIRAIRALGYKIKLDSNGFRPTVLRDLIGKGLLDYVAMDIKNSPEKYSLTAGVEVDISAIEESVSLLMNSGIAYEFRTTSVQEFHDYSDFVKIGKWIAGANRYFIQHYVDSEYCIQRHFHELSPQKAQECLKIVQEYVPSAQLRGY